MSAIAHERAVQRVPGFLAITWAVFVGFVLAAISVGVVGGAAFLIGFVGRDPSTHEPAAAIDWPFTHSGAWSITANAVITAGVLFTSAYWIAERVSHRSAEPVSLARTFAIVLVTGYAPYVGYRGLLPLHFVLGLLATAFLVRRYALGFPPLELAPRTRLVPDPRPELGPAPSRLPSAQGPDRDVRISSQERRFRKGDAARRLRGKHAAASSRRSRVGHHAAGLSGRRVARHVRPPQPRAIRDALHPSARLRSGFGDSHARSRDRSVSARRQDVLAADGPRDPADDQLPGLVAAAFE